MKILINAASAHMGGAVTYLKNTLSWLPNVAPDDDFVVCLPEETRKDAADKFSGSNVHFIDYPYTQTNGLARLYFDQVDIPLWISRRNIDLLFSTTGFGTFRSTCPEVLLVRNPVYFNQMFHAKYRELGRSLTKNTLRRWYSLISIRQSDAVLFPTQAMQAMVEQYVDMSTKKTKSIHYGFDTDFFHTNSGNDLPVLKRIESWKQKDYRIILNVSAYAIHKNFETLVGALSLLLENGHKVKLITTTSRNRTGDKEEYDALQKQIRYKDLNDAFIEIGHVAYGKLSALYQAVDVFVFPSFTESFGHPMVEAMASGLPLVVADTPVNREVCRDAALYFDAFSSEICARQIARCLHNPKLAERLRNEAKNRAADYSWRKHVKNLVDLFRKVKDQK